MAELLRIEALAVTDALRGVWLGMAEGETLGVLGESGAGKTVLARAVLGLQRPSAGQVLVAGASRRIPPEVRLLQPGLDPWWRVGAALRELAPAERVAETLRLVGLPPAVAACRPAELTPEEAWRVTLARALVARPRLLVLDDPTRDLDHAVQAERLRLLRAVQATLPMAWLVLSRDPFVLGWLCERMAVLHLGRVVEEAPAGASPRHPHSRALLDSVPKLELRPPRPALRPDSAPHGVVPAGCAFHPRCALADMECLEREPDLLEVAEAPPGGHKVRCHHWRKLDGQ